MNNSTYFIKLQLKSLLKEILYKDIGGKRNISKIIFSQVIFSLPIILIIFLKQKLLLEFFNPMNITEALMIFYITYLSFIATGKIIANIFFAEDYDIYLALPIKLKDILISKLIETNLRNMLDSLFIFFILGAIGSVYRLNIFIIISLLLVLMMIEVLFTIYIYIGSALFISLKKLKFKALALCSSAIVGLLFIKAFGVTGILNKVFFLNIIKSGNYIVMAYIYIVISILVVISVGVLTFRIYRNIIDNRSNSNLSLRKSKKVEINRKSIVKSLIIKDLKKIIGNKGLNQGLIIGNTMMFISFITICSIMGEKFISVGAGTTLIIFMTILMPIATVVATGLPQNLISIDGDDRDLIVAMPVKTKHILESKIITSLIINIPSIIVVIIMSFIYFINDPFALVMAILLGSLSFIAFILVALNEDIKKPKFNWYNAKELLDDYGKTLKILTFSFPIVLIYIISGYLKGSYGFLIILVLIMSGVSIINYKKIERVLGETYYEAE